MIRENIMCTNCASKDLRVSYHVGPFGDCWVLELICEECGWSTLLATTKYYVPALDLVNEKRYWRNPTQKLKGENEDGTGSESNSNA